jgi:hypothetical protein
MTAIQQIVEIDSSRCVLRLEKPLPESVSLGRADIVLVFQRDAPASRLQARQAAGRPRLVIASASLCERAKQSSGIVLYGLLKARLRAPLRSSQ